MWHGLLFYCVLGRIALTLKKKTITRRVECLRPYLHQVSASCVKKFDARSLMLKLVYYPILHHVDT